MGKSVKRPSPGRGERSPSATWRATLFLSPEPGLADSVTGTPALTRWATFWRPCGAAHVSSLLDRRQNARGGHGELQHARAYGVVNGVGDHGAHGDDGGFAASQRGLAGVVDDDGLDLRQPGETRELVGIEVTVEDFAILEAHFLGERVAQAHGDAAFHLLAQAVGVDDDAGVERGDHPLDLHFAGGLADGQLRHGGYVSVRINAAGDADTASTGGLGGLPSELFGDGFDGAAHARVEACVGPTAK